MKLSILQHISDQQGDTTQKTNVKLVERDGLLFIQGKLENNIENIIQEVREERNYKITRVSQNEVFQQALKLFLPTLPSKKKLSDHPAFGSWKNKNIESLDYQIALREEWIKK